ncbi:heterokaryon incompatibility protein-domain-containing protein, partial [Rhexocercosporidium sp. MPI-PUGE-AT-0058]
MDDQGNGYNYSPLNMSEDIRLVILDPLPASASFHEPISCKFIHARFANRPAYQALSYTWGKNTERKPIHVDSQVASVTKNLWSALWGLRAHDQRRGISAPRCLWIDALCINQNDIKERNHQVRLMSQIYSQAEEVLAWLGSKESAASLAVEVLASLGGRLRCSNLEMRHWQALEQMTNLEYFSRMWIVQEVVLARRLTLYCDSQSVNWSQLSLLFDYLESRNYPSDYLPTNYPYRQTIKRSQALSLDRSRKSFQTNTLSLLTLMRVCASCKCSDPRDKVFALLGIAKDCQNNELTADYSKNLFEVYQDVMQFWNPHE